MNDSARISTPRAYVPVGVNMHAVHSADLVCNIPLPACVGECLTDMQSPYLDADAYLLEPGTRHQLALWKLKMPCYTSKIHFAAFRKLFQFAERHLS